METGVDIWLPLTLLLAIAMASHLIMTRFKLPAVVGELLVGVILAAFTFRVFTERFDLINVFAQLGAIILLFLVGLESDLKQTYTLKSFWIAVGGVLLPWIGGFVLAEFFFKMEFVQAFVVGSMLVATSVAIPARLFMDYGKMDTPTARVILGAAVVDDVIAMTLLAITVSLGQDTLTVFSVSWTVFKALAFVILGTLVGSYVVKRIITFLDQTGKKRGLKNIGFMVAFAGAFMYAWMAEVFGLSAIIGAFVAGASFSDMESSKDLRIGGEYLQAIFTPIFFISLGLLVHFDWDTILNSLLLGVGFAIIVFIAKSLGAGLVAKLFGLSDTNSLIVGISMSPVGEVALIIALYGFSNQLISNEIYTGAIFMVIVLSLAVPFLLKPLLLRGRIHSKNLTKLYHGCDACLGPIWSGDARVVCKCGANFHHHCAEKLEVCPECKDGSSLPKPE